MLDLMLNLFGAQRIQRDLFRIEIKLRYSPVNEANNMFAIPIPHLHFTTLSIPPDAAEDSAKSQYAGRGISSFDFSG